MTLPELSGLTIIALALIAFICQRVCAVYKRQKQDIEELSDRLYIYRQLAVAQETIHGNYPVHFTDDLIWHRATENIDITIDGRYRDLLKSRTKNKRGEK